MMIYQPFISSSDRIVWYGGESTQLHYEIQDSTGAWFDENVRTLGVMPTRIKDLLLEMHEYYDCCTTMELERRIEMAD